MQTPRTIRTVIVVDPMGHGFGEVTAEMEIAEYVERFTEMLSPCKLDWKRKYGVPPPLGTELLIYDFGGMMPGTDLTEKNAWHLVRWARDTPSALAVIVSTFTYRNYIEIELKESGLDLANIICEDGSQEAEDKIRAWLGVEHPPVKPLTAHLITPTLLNAGIELPAARFFEPRPAFFKWMARFKDELPVYDVGAGEGHVAQGLRDHGFIALAIDTCKREGQIRVEIADGSFYDYPRDCVVMICRPCHGVFPGAVLDEAVSRDVKTIVYVGKPKSAERDLGRYRSVFRRQATHVGKGDESLYAWIRRA